MLLLATTAELQIGACDDNTNSISSSSNTQNLEQLVESTSSSLSNLRWSSMNQVCYSFAKMSLYRFFLVSLLVSLFVGVLAG